MIYKEVPFKYSIQVLNLGDDLTGLYSSRWLAADCLITTGDNLEQLIDNASVSTVDQDGGEGPFVSIGDLTGPLFASYSKLIEERLKMLEAK